MQELCVFGSIHLLTKGQVGGRKVSTVCSHLVCWAGLSKLQYFCFQTIVKKLCMLRMEAGTDESRKTTKRLVAVGVYGSFMEPGKWGIENDEGVWLQWLGPAYGGVDCALS